MTDVDDRPDWLPAPDMPVRASPWKRLAALLARLPYLIFTAVGIGAAMLAVAGLLFPVIDTHRSSWGAAIVLLMLSGLCFGVARVLSGAPRLGLRKFLTSTASSTGRPMTTQQFFSALLRALAIWQFVYVLAELPQMIGIVVSQFSNNSQLLYVAYLLGPALRAAIGVVLFWKADWLARLFYPEP
jgi:hypothetical protein